MELGDRADDLILPPNNDKESVYNIFNKKQFTDSILDNPNNKVFKPNSFVNFVNGRYTLFEMDKEWYSDKLYNSLLNYLDQETSAKFNFGLFLTSSVGAVFLSPYFLVICCLCIRKLIK